MRLSFLNSFSAVTAPLLKTFLSLPHLETTHLNKSILVKKIIARLTENLGLLQKAAQAAHAEATHESSKAENKYDTRGLEAAYLAGGQARQAKEIQDAIAMYESLAVRPFSTGQPIDLTAVVDLE